MYFFNLLNHSHFSFWEGYTMVCIHIYTMYLHFFYQNSVYLLFCGQIYLHVKLPIKKMMITKVRFKFSRKIYSKKGAQILNLLNIVKLHVCPIALAKNFSTSFKLFYSISSIVKFLKEIGFEEENLESKVSKYF